MEKIFTTERLMLKIIDGTNAEEVLDYYLRNREFIKEWEPIRTDEFFTLNNLKELLNSEYDSIKAGNSFKYWIYKKDCDNKDINQKLIGSVAFTNIVEGCFLSCNLGYKLDKDEINCGFITEAIQLGINIMFHEFGLHRIEANIMPKNKRSLRVVEKLGFYHEGLAYKYLKINGNWEDHIHMVLRNKDIENIHFD